MAHRPGLYTDGGRSPERSVQEQSILELCSALTSPHHPRAWRFLLYFRKVWSLMGELFFNRTFSDDLRGTSLKHLWGESNAANKKGPGFGEETSKSLSASLDSVPYMSCLTEVDFSPSVLVKTWNEWICSLQQDVMLPFAETIQDEHPISERMEPQGF